MAKEVRQLYDALFREVYHKVIYIEITDMKPISDAVEVIDGATGVLAYGFMEERASLTFMVLASVRASADGFVPGPAVDHEYCRFRYSDAEECRYVVEEELPVDVTQFDDVKERVATLFEPQDKMRLAMLDYELIDMSRNLAFPEFVSLTLYNGRLSPEMVWARPVRIGSEGEFYGYIANPTRQNYGISTEDEIMFRAYDNGNGGIQLMWDGRGEEEETSGTKH